MHWYKCITNVFTSEKRGTFKILFQPLYFRGQDRISNFLYIPTKFLLKTAFLKNYTTMALFYILSIRGQGNNNMRCSIHSMPRQTLWVSHNYYFAPYIRRCISLTFRKCKITSTGQLSLLWILCIKKIKHRVLFQMIQYNSLHMFFEKKKPQISWFQLTFKILGFAISHQFKMNDIYFA